jgi:drug/metabolite transporter (DMT)-like permease
MADGRRIDVALLVVALTWGSSYFAAKVATAAAAVVVVLALRYAISAGTCVALGGLRRCSSTEARLGVVLGVSQGAVLALETYGVAHTTAANAGLLISLTIVLTPLLSGGPQLPARYLAAAGCSIAGVAAIMLGAGFHSPRSGDLLVLAAAVVRGAHVALIGRLCAGRTVRPLALTTVQTLVGTAAFGVPAALYRPVALPVSAWCAIGYLALFCSVLAFLVQTAAVQRTSASRASLLLGTEPVWAVAAAVWLGGEHLSLLAAGGAVMVLGGTYAGQAIERTSRRTEALACLTTPITV